MSGVDHGRRSCGQRKKETGRWKDRWKIRDLLAEGRCSQAVLDFLSSMDVGRQVPTKEDDAVSAVSKLEVREWLDEQEVGAEEPGGGIHHVPSHAGLHGVCRRGIAVSFVLSL